MPIIRATVIRPFDIGGPGEEARNVWHFSSDDTSPAVLNGIADGLVAFYNGLSAYHAGSLDNSANKCKIEMAQVTPGGPGAADDDVSALLATRLWTLSTPNTAAVQFPTQVAAAFSFSSQAGAVPEEEGLIRPRSRRRGRIFLGPLTAGSADYPAGRNCPVPSAVFRETTLDSYDIAHQTWDDLLIYHVVYSRKQPANLAVDLIWMDNRYDVIRRRAVPRTEKHQRVVNPLVAGADRTGVVIAIGG